MEGSGTPTLERALLQHLLDHRGHQVRFEADQWTTEFGIFRAFAQEDQTTLKGALRSLEMSRLIYRRVQYVIGYSEPKLIYSLTPSGHRKALDDRRGPDNGGPELPLGVTDAPPDGPSLPAPPASDGGVDPDEIVSPPGAPSGG